MSEPKSNCCHVPAWVETGIMDLGGVGCTNHYTCTKCGEECDTEPETTPVDHKKLEGIVRYSSHLGRGFDGSPIVGMKRDDDGEWVTYYDAITEIARLRTEIARARSEGKVEGIEQERERVIGMVSEAARVIQAIRQSEKGDKP